MTAPEITDVIALPADLSTLPDPEPFYYAVGQREKYIVKRTMFGKAIVAIDKIDHLPDEKGKFWPDVPKVPASVISQVWSFFRDTFKTKGSESMVYLTYKDGVWRPFIPPQEASYAHVRADFKLENIAPGWRLAASIHSHCDFNGFHSDTDEKDAREHEGLHITIGDVDKDEPSVAAMISISGVLFTMEPADVIEGDLDKLAEHPSYWNAFVRGAVRRPPKANRTVGEFAWQSGRGYQSGNGYLGWTTDDEYIDHAMSYGSRTTYVPNVSERSFFDLVEANVRRGATIGDEEDLFSLAVELDTILDDLREQAESLGIEFDLYLRRRWEAGQNTKIGRELPLVQDRLLLGEGDDINDVLTTTFEAR